VVRQPPAAVGGEASFYRVQIIFRHLPVKAIDILGAYVAEALQLVRRNTFRSEDDCRAARILGTASGPFRIPQIDGQPFPFAIRQCVPNY
jgi:hypothetical protein